MASVYAAVVGCKHHFGIRIFKPGQILTLKKDLENEYDDEAIAAYLASVGKVGYVANSTGTVPKGCRSAGRIYDTFDMSIQAAVRFVTKDTVIIEILRQESHTREVQPKTV